MTAKQYLGEVIKLKKKAKSLEQKEEELRAKAEGLRAITYDKDKVQTSAADRMPEVVAEMVEVQAEIGETVAECYRQIKEREERISGLKSIRQIEVLRWRYLEDKDGRQYTFEEIAEQMHVSDKSVVFRMHKRAIRSFAIRWKMVLE